MRACWELLVAAAVDADEAERAEREHPAGATVAARLARRRALFALAAPGPFGAGARAGGRAGEGEEGEGEAAPRSLFEHVGFAEEAGGTGARQGQGQGPGGEGAEWPGGGEGASEGGAGEGSGGGAWGRPQGGSEPGRRGGLGAEESVAATSDDWVPGGTGAEGGIAAYRGRSVFWQLPGAEQLAVLVLRGWRSWARMCFVNRQVRW